MTEGFPPVFVISLARSTERRRIMAQRLEAAGVPYRFFDAVDGHALDLGTLPDYARTQRRLCFGRDMTKGEVGCLLSHRAIYRHMLDNNIDRAIVLEDDAILSPDFSDAVRAVLAAPVPWDVIRFLDSEKVFQKSRVVARLRGGGHALLRTWIASGGAYGYLLTQNAAATFLRHMKTNAVPVDTLHGYVWKTGLETFALWPSPVAPDRVIDSTIGDARFDKTSALHGWEKWVHPFARAGLKLWELVGKRWAYGASFWRDV